MDFFSHIGWTYLLSLSRKDWRRTWKEFVFFGVLPDLMFAVPLLALFLPLAPTLLAAGFELPEFHAAEGVYKISHSYLTALLVFAGASLALKKLCWPVLGWFLHISIDVFTHKGSVALQVPFYPMPYAVEGFIRWNDVLFMSVSWAALALILLWLNKLRRATYNKKLRRKYFVPAVAQFGRALGCAPQ